MVLTERKRIPDRLQAISLKGALSVTLTLLIILCITPMPRGSRAIIVSLLTLGWIGSGIQWAYRRFGRVVVIALMVSGMVSGGVMSYAYWRDQPNRQIVRQIKGLHAYYVGTNGTFLTGEVDYVYFDSEASDQEVEKFAQSDGIAGLKRLVFKGTKLSDSTALKLGRFSQLRNLYLENTGIDPATIEQLRPHLPICKIEVQ